jgi:hypothetical protein
MKNLHISIPGLITGSVMSFLLIILPFEIAISVILSFFVGYLSTKSAGIKLWISLFGLDFSSF